MNSVGRRLRLAPSLLSADFGALGAAVAAAEAGGADALHLDVMDGHFVPNISFGPALVQAVRARTKLPLDVHLMIEEPGRFVEAFAAAGGSTLIFHREAKAEPRDLIPKVRSLGAEVGLAINPETPFEAAQPWLEEIDQLLVMSVHPGFSGQKFLPEALPKLRAARAAFDALGSKADLSIDGGITVETAAPAAAAGASFFVCGNSVFVGGSVEQNLAGLRRAVTAGAGDEVR
ncbi:MAG: ribulose-phosphate 3-epimerase [Thermoplasmata archaeon]|nr:ribulose-phosphate 3-epimerase [Thermoplasmata archaeon]